MHVGRLVGTCSTLYIHFVHVPFPFHFPFRFHSHSTPVQDSCSTLLTSDCTFVYIYIYICMSRRVHTVHMRMRGNYVKRLHGMCTLCPLSKNRRLDQRHERLFLLWRLAKSGRRVCPNAKLDIHVLRRRKRLPTEIAEERDTPAPALC